MRYRKKPVEIEAVQFDGTEYSTAYILGWMEGAGAGTATYVGRGHEHRLRRETERDPGNGNFYEDRAREFLVIPTLEGDMRADVNDWIIKGVKGEFYPCKPDIFAATYDAV